MGGLETFNKTNLQLRAKDNKKAPKILNPRGFALMVSGPDETIHLFTFLNFINL
jgi:hypothetical protein